MYNMQIIERKYNILFPEHADMEHLHTFRDFPVYIGCTDEPFEKDVRADMIFDICRDTGVIQLRSLLPLDVVYGKYHSEAIGGIWEEHHSQFAELVAQSGCSHVLEVGGSNGAFAKEVLKRAPDVSWTIVEPSPLQLEDERITVVSEYFDEKFQPSFDVDTIVHSHVLEHMYDPIIAIERMRDILPIGGKHIFSIPNLFLWFQNKQVNTLNFEHSVFLTEYFVDALLARYGFHILHKEYYGEHSIFYETERVEDVKSVALKNKYEEYKGLFLDFVEYHDRIAENFNKKIVNSDQEVYLFGAHIFSQFLVHSGLDASRIDCVLDNSQIKQGKRLYGTSLRVKSPDLLRGKDRPVVILKVGAYRDEVVDQLRHINSSVVIVE